ncbi:TetR family transcriptional regulator [Chloroflexota bacterium]
MRRTKEDAAITRDKLLDVALSVFSKNGYSATRLGDIAKEAGVTRGAIYWHFGSKSELYSSLVQEYSNRGSSIAQQAIEEGGSVKEIIRRIFVRLLSSIEDDRKLRAMMEISLFKTELTPELRASRQTQIENGRVLIGGISEAIRQGVISGELRSDLDPSLVARAFIAYQNGAIHLWLFDPDSFSLKESADSFADIFMSGISS